MCSEDKILSEDYVLEQINRVDSNLSMKKFLCQNEPN